jgi:hypothetical protein
MIKSAATTADVVKIWFDRLNVSVSRILSTINTVRSDPRVFSQVEGQSRFINASLGFVKDSTTNKVENYLRNVKKLKGNHPHIRACNGIIRLSDMVMDRLEKAIDAQKNYLEAVDDQDEDQDMKLLTANRSWDITIEAAQKLSEQINILRENVLRDFSAQDFSPPGQAQLDPRTPQLQPARQQGQVPQAPMATVSPSTVKVESNQIAALLNYLKKVPAFLTGIQDRMSALNESEKQTYQEIKNVCQILMQSYNSLGGTYAPYGQLFKNILDALNENNVASVIPMLQYITSAQQPADAQPGQQTGQEAGPTENLEEKFKQHAKRNLELISNKLKEVIDNRTSKQSEIKKFLQTNMSTNKQGDKFVFKKNINKNLISDSISHDRARMLNIIGLSNEWTKKEKAHDLQNLDIIREGFQRIYGNAYDIISKIDNLKQIWEKGEDIELNKYPGRTTDQIKGMQGLVLNLIKETETTEAVAGKTSMKKNSLSKLASQIYAAVEQFNHLVSLAKKQSGVATKTNPSLWSRCKSEAKSRMGGKHSARAMQLAVKLYKQRGGGYKGKKPTARTNKMKKWTKQKWMYLSDYKKKKKDKNKLDDHLIEDTYFDSVITSPNSFEDENDAKDKKLSYDEELSVALGNLETLVRHEGIESTEVKDQIEQAAWEFGYYLSSSNEKGNLPDWMKFLGKHYKIDVNQEFKNGFESGKSKSNDSNDAKGRYLPEAKWKSLSPKERSATDQKKKRQGKNKQYVPNTEAAKVKSKAKYY